MNELIQITEQQIAGNAVQAVSARDLHSALGVKDQFSHWAKRYTKKFVSEQDFSGLTLRLQSGHTQQDYAFSLDMAKHVAMMSETDKSMEVRQYFIECEKKLQALRADPTKALNDPAILRQTLLGYAERVIALEATVKEQAPKVAALDRISTADGSLCITDAAKHLQVRPKDLFGHLIQKLWIYKRRGNSAWHGYQIRVQQGLIEHKVTTVSRSDGTEKLTEQVRITPKGLNRLAGELEAA